VHSIELSKNLYEKAVIRFKNNPSIHLYLGDSAQILGQIINKLGERTVFFLDGHFSEGDTAKGDENTPIVKELEHIKKAGIKNSFIIIDDARLFNGPRIETQNSSLEGYPSINKIIDIILSINSDYKIAIIGDFIIAFPKVEKLTVSPLVISTTISRLFDGNNYHIEDVLEAEKIIAFSTDVEKDALIKLNNLFVNDYAKKYKYAEHYALWYGLILLANKKFDDALKQLQMAEELGLTDSRILLYKNLASSHLSL
jgi:hypothetical protein